MKIDRTKKIALAGLAVTAVMLAIVLPVALNNSEVSLKEVYSIGTTVVLPERVL